MKLSHIWEKIGKQPLKFTQHQDGIVFIDDIPYEITNIRYENGKFLGFEISKNDVWFDEEDKPQKNRFVIVKDKDGKEYINHQWNGVTWYEYVISDDGCDGWPSDVNIVSWHYQKQEDIL